MSLRKMEPGERLTRMVRPYRKRPDSELTPKQLKQRRRNEAQVPKRVKAVAYDAKLDAEFKAEFPHAFDVNGLRRGYLVPAYLWDLDPDNRARHQSRVLGEI